MAFIIHQMAELTGLQSPNGMTRKYIFSMARCGNTLFAGALNLIYHSTDNGSSWSTGGSPTSGMYYSLNVQGNNVFASTSVGLYVSTNQGTSWTYSNDNLPQSTEVYTTLIKGSDIYIGTYGFGIFKRPISDLVGITKDENKIPSSFSLGQNYPNPFNPGTVISYALPSASHVKLTIYNTIGEAVKVLENGNRNAGNYSVEFNGAGLPSGIYIYKLEAGDFTQSRKMILLK